MIPSASSQPELAFSLAEYRERCGRLRSLMHESQLDMMLVHNPASVFYFSGYENLHVYDNECVIVPAHGDIGLLVPRADIGRARLTSWVEQITSFPYGGEPADLLAAEVVERRLSEARVGIEKKAPRAACLSVHTYERLRERLPRATFVDASGLPERVKLTKSPQEIMYLREAAKLTDAGIRAAFETAAEGKTDNEVAAAAYQAMMNAGSEFLSIPAIVNGGSYTGISHSTHKRHHLKKGDVLFLELGGCYQRYSAPCMRSASIGPATDDAKRLAEGCLTALECMHQTMRPGVAFHDVAEAGARGVERAGAGIDWGGDYGYPVGAGFPPHWGDYTCRIRLGEQTRLLPGMVFHQPIALRIAGKVGVAFSETVLITERGCEILTRTPRELIVR